MHSPTAEVLPWVRHTASIEDAESRLEPKVCLQQWRNLANTTLPLSLLCRDLVFSGSEPSPFSTKPGLISVKQLQNKSLDTHKIFCLYQLHQWHWDTDFPFTCWRERGSSASCHSWLIWLSFLWAIGSAMSLHCWRPSTGHFIIRWPRTKTRPAPRVELRAGLRISPLPSSGVTPWLWSEMDTVSLASSELLSALGPKCGP